MKSTPILMKPEMIRAYMAGQKTQTRRVIKNVPPGTDYYHPGWAPNGDRVFTPYQRTNDLERPKSMGKSVKCPYGQPGDELWFREVFKFLGTDMNRLGRTHYHQDGVFQYKSDGEEKRIKRPWMDIEKYMVGHTKWRPSIHMPRWACRHTAKIIDIRVERIRNISEEDAIKEGIQMTDELWPREVFEELWDSINGKKTGCTWADNPLVWVIKFERYQP